MPTLLSELLQAWVELRHRHQLLLTTILAFCMYAASDVLSQVLTQRMLAKEPKSAPLLFRIDSSRLLRSGAISSFLSGFVAVFYFRWLEDTFRQPPSWAGKWTAAGSWVALGRFGWLLPTLCKVVIDVFCYEAVYDVMYLSLQALMRGDLVKPEGITLLLAELAKVPRIWRMSPRYWGPVDFVNFALVDLRLRPLWNACFSIPWATYLSSMANDDAKVAAPNTVAERADDRR